MLYIFPNIYISFHIDSFHLENTYLTFKNAIASRVLMVHSHCTGPGPGMRLGTMSLYVMLCTVHRNRDNQWVPYPFPHSQSRSQSRPRAVSMSRHADPGPRPKFAHSSLLRPNTSWFFFWPLGQPSFSWSIFTEAGWGVHGSITPNQVRW